MSFQTLKIDRRVFGKPPHAGGGGGGGRKNKRPNVQTLALNFDRYVHTAPIGQDHTLTYSVEARPSGQI